MFEELNKHIGEEVRCKYIAKKELNEIKGKLVAIHEYKSIVVGHVCVPFMGMKIGVQRVESITNKPYYINPLITDNYECTSEEELQSKKKEFYGESYNKNIHKVLAKTYTIGNKKNKR